MSISSNGLTPRQRTRGNANSVSCPLPVQHVLFSGSKNISGRKHFFRTDIDVLLHAAMNGRVEAVVVITLHAFASLTFLHQQCLLLYGKMAYTYSFATTAAETFWEIAKFVGLIQLDLNQ